MFLYILLIKCYFTMYFPTGPSFADKVVGTGKFQYVTIF